MAESVFEVKITADMIDLPKISQRFREANFDPPLKDTCYRIVQDAKKRIRARQSVFGGRYPNLAEKTIRDKKREHSTQPYLPLYRTGKMFRSIVFGKVFKNHWRVYVKHPHAFKTRIHTYEAMHMPNLPARQFMFFDQITIREYNFLRLRILKYARNVFRKVYVEKTKKILFGKGAYW